MSGALGFNPTPAVGETHTVAGKTWQWNGTGWEKYMPLDTLQIAFQQGWFETAVSAGADGGINELGTPLSYL